MSVVFSELLGELRQTGIVKSEAGSPVVIRSSISHGASIGPRWSGLTVRFVGQGTEHYSIAGRYYRVSEDQLMIAPQIVGSEVEVRRSERQPTLGLCVYLPESIEGLEAVVDGPVVLPASCRLGASLRSALHRISLPVRSRDEPRKIASDTCLHLRETVLELEREVDALPGLKRRTRFEAVRRMNLAKAYLHHVTSRAVTLEELGREVGVSSFQLLRSFRDCFGETPAAYHRRLRLTLAREAAAENRQPLSFVADRFGFAGGASLSHAHRRTFGKPPVRALKSRIAG